MGLFSSIGGAIGTLVGGPIGGSVGSSFGSYADDKNKADYSWKRQKRMFNWQKDWEQYKMLNAHQMQMEDLKNAGINPLATAVMGGAQGTGAPTGGNTPTFNDTSTPFSENMNNLTQVENANKLTPTQVDVNESLALKNKKEAGVIDKKANAEIKESESRTAVNQAQLNKIAVEIENIATTTIGQTLLNQLNEIEVAFNNNNYTKALRYINETINTIKNGGNATASFMPLVGTLGAVKGAKNLAPMINSLRNSNIWKLLPKK